MEGGGCLGWFVVGILFLVFLAGLMIVIPGGSEVAYMGGL